METPVVQARRAVVATLILTVACCGVYPLVVYGIAALVFPHQANGSLVVGPDGAVRGSVLLGQRFSQARYFHPRPSAAGAGYDGSSSGGSNLGPTSRKLNDALRERTAAYRSENGLADDVPVPADAVMAPGSGLDPHISLRNAALQSVRVAKARNLPVERIREVLQGTVEGPDLGVLGEPGVNVLMLNLALDSLPAE